MFVAIGFIDILIPHSKSIKDKRAAVKSTLSRAKNEFNISIAEIEKNDVHHRALPGFSFVGNEKIILDRKTQMLINFVAQMNITEIVGSSIEIMAISDELQQPLFEVGKYEL